MELTLATHDTDIKASLATIASYIDTEIAAIETKLDSPDNFKADVSALSLEGTLTAIKGVGWSTETLKVIKDAIDALNNLAASEVWTYATRTLTSHAFPFTNPAAALDVSNIRTAAYPLLTNGTYGLSALKTLIDAIEGKLDFPTDFMADVSGLAPANEYDTEMARITANVATEAKQDVIDGIVDEIISDTATINWGDITALDGLIDGIIADIGVFPTANYATFAAYVEDIRTRLIAIVGDTNELQTDWADGGRLDLLLDKILTGVIQGTGTVLPANKSLYDILWVDPSLDEIGSFNWDTSVYTTSEISISALFTSNLNGSYRRKYMIYLDLTEPAEDDAAWTECTIKVKLKIDGSSYRTIDKCIKARTDLTTSAEPGVPIEVPMVGQDVSITMQFDVALDSDRTIYYHRVEEKLEY